VKPGQISRVLTSNFRDILQKSEANVEAVANAVNFMTAQREHKVRSCLSYFRKITEQIAGASRPI